MEKHDDGRPASRSEDKRPGRNVVSAFHSLVSTLTASCGIC